MTPNSLMCILDLFHTVIDPPPGVGHGEGGGSGDVWGYGKPQLGFGMSSFFWKKDKVDDRTNAREWNSSFAKLVSFFAEESQDRTGPLHFYQPDAPELPGFFFWENWSKINIPPSPM